MLQTIFLYFKNACGTVDCLYFAKIVSSKSWYGKGEESKELQCVAGADVRFGLKFALCGAVPA